MLITAEKFTNMPVMSLQTGSELARTSRAIINPYNLKIIAYELSGPLLDQSPSLLRIEDIRETGPMGLIIDSVDELLGLDDVIKIKEIYELNFNLEGLKVVDERKRNVGRVIGYTLEAGNFIIQQLRVKRPLMQSFSDVELLVHRTQILHISTDKIVVKSPEIRKNQVLDAPLPTFENPFRKSHPQSDSNSQSTE